MSPWMSRPNPGPDSAMLKKLWKDAHTRSSPTNSISHGITQDKNQKKGNEISKRLKHIHNLNAQELLCIFGKMHIRKTKENQEKLLSTAVLATNWITYSFWTYSFRSYDSTRKMLVNHLEKKPAISFIFPLFQLFIGGYRHHRRSQRRVHVVVTSFLKAFLAE